MTKRNTILALIGVAAVVLVQGPAASAAQFKAGPGDYPPPNFDPARTIPKRAVAIAPARRVYRGPVRRAPRQFRPGPGAMPMRPPPGAYGMPGPYWMGRPAYPQFPPGYANRAAPYPPAPPFYAPPPYARAMAMPAQRRTMGNAWARPPVKPAYTTPAAKPRRDESVPKITPDTPMGVYPPLPNQSSAGSAWTGKPGPDPRPGVRTPQGSQFREAKR